MRTTHPVVSVVMPVYNAGRFLREAMESILEQSFRDFELIIIDDGSSDDSRQVMTQFHDDRIQLIFNDRNRGLVYSLNRGIEAAKGEFIARFDADDVSDLKRFALQVDYLRSKPEIAACSSKIQLIDIYGNPAGFWPEDEMVSSEEEIKSMMPFSNCIAHPAMMIRSRDLQFFRYNDDYRAEDWGLWLEMLSEGKRITKLPHILLKYRIHPKSFTHQKNAIGPYKRSILFKLDYLSSKFNRRKFKAYDCKVIYALIHDLVRYPWRSILRPLLSKIKQAIQRRPWQIVRLIRLVMAIPASTRVVFLFPYYHTGGAENVHDAIVKSVDDTKPVILFTAKSSDDRYLKSFETSAHCIDVSDLIYFPLLKKWLRKTIASKINSLPEVTVFSSNTDVFYDLIPSFKLHVKKVDLIHAFVDELEDGPEKWSLPHVHLINERVFVSKRALHKMEEFYDKNGIKPEFKKRLRFIRNFTIVPSDNPQREYIAPLKIVYIGRAGAEKRVPVLLKVAYHFKEDQSVKFTFIGDIAQIVPDDLKPFIGLPGTLNPDDISKYLSDSHVLLLSSSREGMPMVIFEAMAHGVVPISTPVGDVPDYIQEGKTGFLLPLQPDNEIIVTLIHLIEKLKSEPELLRCISNNVYSKAKSEFDRQTFIDAYRKIVLSK